ncbi:class I SAM-dependent methyltransferase [Streptomyces subrutilus]|uniref:class I SAM-dependent methyltransferase n=1 Tax=Streptomyces subrutilus TaxID=36818 RepID=UPI0033F072C5
MPAHAFDQAAELYDASEAGLPFRGHIEIPSVLAAIGDIRGKRVADLGCGAGLYARVLAKSGASAVTGLDRSAGMIAHARQRDQAEGTGITYLLHDISHPPPLPAQGLDAVVCVYVLPYASTQGQLTDICRTARTLLSPGGRFIAATLNPDFATAPDYYRPYGFTLIPRHDVTPRHDASTEPPDGHLVELNTWVGTNTFTATSHRWSRHAHQSALREAGFTDISWSAPTLHTTETDGHWSDYLTRPHTLIISAH